MVELPLRCANWPTPENRDKSWFKNECLRSPLHGEPASAVDFLNISDTQTTWQNHASTRHNSATPFRFNITPMIDVVFLLIIFFLVASYFVRSEQSREVSLPEASKGKPDDFSAQKRLTITVDKDGQLSIAGNVVSEDEIIDRIRLLLRRLMKQVRRQARRTSRKFGFDQTKTRVMARFDA